jgi:ribosomal protein S18 acetylase RimI-like enzyme
MIRLVPMSLPEYELFVARSAKDYAAEHVRAGTWEAGDALRRAHAELGELLPQGLDTPDHFLRSVWDASGDERVGELWYCFQRAQARPQLFVYWIGIDEKHRRRGFATDVFERLEAVAREAGAHRVALHVFGDNTAAQAFYHRLGYRATNIVMAKDFAK